ncbi:MAG: helix-turn-helix domain-containing protein [Terriglobia bacterium]
MVIYPVPKFKPKQREENGALAPPKALLAAEENREVLTVALAARLLGKSPDTIYRWLSEGRLAGRKVGGRWLVYRDSVDVEWRAGLVEPEKD